VTVSGDAKLEIRTDRGAALEGKVEAEGGSALPAGLRLTVYEVEYAAPVAAGASTSGPSFNVGADGRVAIASLLGPKIFRVSGLPDGWALRGIWLDDSEVTDVAVDLKSTAAPRQLRVVVTTRGAAISGTVTVGGRPLPEARVLIFPDDEARWNGPSSRFVKSALAASDGRFALRGLLPAKYRVAAFDYIEDNAWNDPDLLRTFKGRSETIEIAEGDNRTLTLTSRGEP
jgi:hypothetical protein